MKTNIEWSFGNFDLTVSLMADIGEGAASEMILAAAGLNILQRTVASAAEKKLAGYEKRPEGFKRDSIPYSEDNADTLSGCFTGQFNLNPKGKPEVWLEYACTGCVEHIVGAKAERKFAAEKVKVREWLTAGTAKEKFEKIGYSGPVPAASATDDEIMPICRALDSFYRNI